jgi:hypothetical protein
MLAAAAAQQGGLSDGREKLAARGGYRCIWGFIFPFGVRRKMLARGETDTPKPTPTGSVTLMLEINQESNARRINSGSTAKSLKTQVFYSQVNFSRSHQSGPLQRPDLEALAPGPTFAWASASKPSES